MRTTPQYAPLISCTSYGVLSALRISETQALVRVVVKPAGSSSMPFAVAQPHAYYKWRLGLQPGCSINRAASGCWMVEGVSPDTPPRI